MNYNLTYTTFTDNNIPPNHREAKIRGYLAMLTKPLQWLRDVFFNFNVNTNNNYIGSGFIEYYENLDYPAGVVVHNFWIDELGSGAIMGDMGVYICIKDTTAAQLPTDSEYWYKISDNLLGFTALNLVNAQTILFEWALNMIMFNNVVFMQFLQPQYQPNRSTIYIENLPSANAFFVGIDESESSNVVFTDSEAISFIYATDEVTEPFNYVIYIPTAFNDAIVLAGQTKEAFMANVVNKFNLSGMSYKIEIY